VPREGATPCRLLPMPSVEPSGSKLCSTRSVSVA
jgi:hypothetical protein